MSAAARFCNGGSGKERQDAQRGWAMPASLPASLVPTGGFAVAVSTRPSAPAVHSKL